MISSEGYRIIFELNQENETKHSFQILPTKIFLSIFGMNIFCYFRVFDKVKWQKQFLCDFYQYSRIEISL